MTDTARKNPAITILLAALPGLIGILGMGHLYLGRVKRGVVYLVVGICLLGLGLTLGGMVSALGMTVPPPGYEPVEPPQLQEDLMVAEFFLLVSFPVLWIVQIVDACRLCREHKSGLP